MKIINSIKHWFYVRYIQFVEMVALYMIARTGVLVRKLLVMKGKDPDYVPPPPPPPEPIKDDRMFPFDAMKAQATLSSFYNTKRPEWVGSAGNAGTDAWIRNPSLHPVFEARRQFEEKQAKLKYQMKVAPPVEEPEVLQVAASESLEGQDEEVKQFSEE